MRKLGTTLCFALAMGMFGIPSAEACPTCKDSFTEEDTANGTKLVSKGLNSTGLGFGWSVLFMLAAPASVASGLVCLVVKNGREPHGNRPS